MSLSARKPTRVPDTGSRHGTKRLVTMRDGLACCVISGPDAARSSTRCKDSTKIRELIVLSGSIVRGESD